MTNGGIVIRISIIIILMIFVLYMFGWLGGRITQDVRSCNDTVHYQVETYVWYNGNIISYHRTWSGDNTCLELNQVDSVKKAEYQNSVTFLKNYKTIN